MFELRPYQADLVDGIRAKLATHRRVLAVAPTGAGKTVMFSYIAYHAGLKGKRVTITAHREEICLQISRALSEMGIQHGRIAAGSPMTSDLVQVAMVQTLARRLDRVPEPDLLIPDEAHHAVAGTWRTVSDAWRNARVLGFTATPLRLDGRGLKDVFETMIVGSSTADLIQGGHLSQFVYLAPPSKIDTSGLRTRMGDYSIAELAEMVDKQVITGDAVSHYRKHADGRPAVAFCVTVAHAEHVAEQFRAAGYQAASVDGKLDKTERRARIAALGSGGLHVLTSCELISEGVDVPSIGCAILLRPTKSLAMHLQQVGRALRKKPEPAIILDHVGNSNQHGMPDSPREWSLDGKDKKEKAPSVTTCELCYRAFAAGTAKQVAREECKRDECQILSAPDHVFELPEQVDGELVQFSAYPDWARGLNIVTASGPYFQELLGLADTEEKLRAIQKARNYHHLWVKRQLQLRNQWRGNRAA